MDIRLLGPVEASVEGHPVALGAGKRRALLAVLALHEGSTVSADQIVDGLWGERPPASAPKMVQMYVSHLRKAMAAAGGGTPIVTRGQGYALRLGTGDVDARRFERLVASGAAREGLALWRGPALDDVAGEPFAAQEIRRLDELRLAALEQALDADLAAGRHREVLGELAALARENRLSEHVHGLRMLALYRSGRQAEALAAYRHARSTLVEEIGVEPGRELRRLHEAILRQDPALDPPRLDVGPLPGREAGLAAEADLAGSVAELQTARARVASGADERVVACPFKGLAAYGVEDAPYFSGRERLTAELVARVAGEPILGIVGPSGSGKSSALRAGLLAALAQGALPGSERRPLRLLRPGAHPLQALERAAANDPGPDRPIVAVDQLEELFTACGDEAEREAFAGALVAAARDPWGPALVLVAVRADYYGRCAAYPELARLLAGNHVLVGALGRADLRRAIELPARRAGLEVEPELADALIAGLDGEPGALPLLSTALLELWRRGDGRLRLAAYEQAGGVRGVVARLAERAYGRLSPAQRPVARGLLLRMAGEGGGTGAVRRRVPLTELDPEGDAAVAEVLGVLAGERLVTIGDGVAEVAHEALLDGWPRLRGWLAGDAAGRDRTGSSAGRCATGTAAAGRPHAPPYQEWERSMGWR